VQASSGDFYFSPTIESTTFKTHSGIKGELRSVDGRWGFLTGLRLTQVRSTIEKTGTPSYFFVRLQQTGYTTQYARVRNLRQSNTFLGVPLEVRFFPFGERRFRIYFLAGGEAGYHIATKNKVTFLNSSMNVYDHTISEIVGEGKNFYGAGYAGGGFEIGKANHPRVTLGMNAPVVVTKKCSSLSSPTAGGGVYIQVQIPL
jgi:hypothetical protein